MSVCGYVTHLFSNFSMCHHLLTTQHITRTSRRALQAHNINVIEEPYSLDVLKDGLVLETLQLTPTTAKTFYLCGRQADLCDIEMAHGSISRVHAVLQYNSDGALMLQDMQSAQVCSCSCAY